MHWRQWAPMDAAIRAEFGYPLDADRATARHLRTIVPPGNRLRNLAGLVRGGEVSLLGCGPSLSTLDASRLAGIVVAADGACSWLRPRGIVPALVVTDLDGEPDDLAWAAQAGAVMVVHAHGDNLQAVRELAPLLGPRVHGTYQGPPGPDLAPLENLGGFTDGDRALLLVEHLGARAARLHGFDFNLPPSGFSHSWDPLTKPKKLAWAKRIVEAAEARGRIRVQYQ